MAAPLGPFFDAGRAFIESEQLAAAEQITKIRKRTIKDVARPRLFIAIALLRGALRLANFARLSTHQTFILSNFPELRPADGE